MRPACCLHRTAPGGPEQGEALQHVVHRQLGEHEDAAVEDEVRVRPEQGEEVREARDRDAEVGTRVAVPLLVEIAAAPSDDRHRGQEVRRREPRAAESAVFELPFRQ